MHRLVVMLVCILPFSTIVFIHLFIFLYYGSNKLVKLRLFMNEQHILWLSYVLIWQYFIVGNVSIQKPLGDICVRCQQNASLRFYKAS